MYKKVYNYLHTPEKAGKKIGLYRTIFSIFGGLLVAYLAMTVFTIITPLSLGESLVIPLYLNTMAWAVCSLWIVLANTRLDVFKRVFIPSFVFLLIILFHILGS